MRVFERPQYHSENCLDFVGLDDANAAASRHPQTPLLATCVQDGWTALMYAARNGHAPVVQALLDSGAAMDLTEKVTKLSECIVVECERYMGTCMPLYIIKTPLWKFDAPNL